MGTPSGRNTGSHGPCSMTWCVLESTAWNPSTETTPLEGGTEVLGEDRLPAILSASCFSAASTPANNEAGVSMAFQGALTAYPTMISMFFSLREYSRHTSPSRVLKEV